MLNKMDFIKAALHHLERGVEWIEEKARGPFVVAAIVVYVVSLVVLATKINPLTDLDDYLVKGLANLSYPFGIILLQELLELVARISRSTLSSTSQQFEIVALVILRSFFKDFYKLNEAVGLGEFGEPVQKAVVKVVALLLIAALIAVFNHLSKRAGIEKRNLSRRTANLLKQALVVILILGVVVYLFASNQQLNITSLITLVFTGMIIIDALFFLWTIQQTNEFSALMFDGGLVVSLILARFPLFASNTLSYCLAFIGTAFATAALYLFIRPLELQFLGNPQEDEVARFDFLLEQPRVQLNHVDEKGSEFLGKLGVPEATILQVREACTHLVDTILEYGISGRKDVPMNIGLALYRDRLAVTLNFQGEPFNPFRRDFQWGHPAGDDELDHMEVHLVRNVMDKVAYRYQDGHNIVTLLKVVENRGLGEIENQAG